MRSRCVFARSEEGSAIIEFIAMTFVLLIPLVYLVLTLSRIEAASYAVTTAARESGRAFITTEKGHNATARARAAADIAFDDQGFGGVGTLDIPDCKPDPCFTPGSSVTTTARVAVELPLIPNFVGSGLYVKLDATHESTVEKFRAGP